VLVGPASIEGVERTNAVMAYLSQRTVFTQCNPYTIDVDRGNKNCYNCGGFGHLTRNYRNRGTENRSGKRRKLEYGQNNRQRLRIKRENGQKHFFGERDLIVFN